MPTTSVRRLSSPVESFDRVVRPDLGPVRRGEGGVGEQVGLHRLEAFGDRWVRRGELVDDGTELRTGGLAVGLSEDRADQRGDHRPVLMSCR